MFFHVPAGKYYKFGDYGNKKIERTEVMKQHLPLNAPPQPLYAEGKVFPPRMPFTTQKWATIPNGLFKNNKDPKYLVQIHYSGKKVRTWSATSGWKESKGSFEFKDAAGNPVGRRSFKLKDKDFLASILVAHAFWGNHPSETRNIVLHILRVEERSEQSDDSVRNIRWGTDKENKEDRTADGQASNNDGLKIAIYGKPVTKDKISLGLPPSVHRDPRFKDGTYARFDSAADAERIIMAHIDEYNRTAETPLKGIASTHISKALSGKAKIAGGYAWLFDAVPEPAATDLRRLDESQLGERYGTRDGRLLYKKWTSDTTYVYVQTTQTARPSGYMQTQLNAHAPDELGNSAPFHRIIAFLFNRAQLDAKLARSGLRMEDLEVDHDDENKFNNASANLVWRTHAEHVAKTHGHRIVERRANGTQVKMFSTTKAAAASVPMHNDTFRLRLKVGGGAATITSNGTTRYFFRSVPDEASGEDDEGESEDADEDLIEDEDDDESEGEDAMEETM